MSSDTGRIFIIAGFLLVLTGVFLSLKGSIPWVGRLPGDILIKKENFSFYFPLTSCLLVSSLISILIYIFRR